MKRKRKKNETRFYMAMSILCLTVLFTGYSFVYNLSEKRKSGKDVTTISINYDADGRNEDRTSIMDKIMSYFNIFLEKTFKEDESMLIDSNEVESQDVFNIIDIQNKFKPYENELVESVDEEPPIEEKQFLSDNRHENFFKVIESPTYRSSAPRDSSFDAASINEEVNIVLFHTHATESYLPYKEGNFRTQDERYNVMGVGTKITANLQGYGLNARHLTDYNDYPDYNSSYYNSCKAVTEALSNSKKNLLIDIHRDGADENSAYEHKLSQVKTVQINDKTAATCTLVIGDKNGNYQELRNNAQKLYDIAEERYPGLFREIIIRQGAYFNQYLSDYSLLIEIGSTLNHIDEANYSAELLSDILTEYIGEISK